MKLLGYDVPLGMSVSSHSPEAIDDFVAHGFTCFEVGIPAYLNKEGITREDIARMEWRGHEEILVDIKKPLFERIIANKLCVWSVHLPFGYGWDVAHYNEQERDLVVESLKRIIDLTACYHPRIYVLHGCLEPVADNERPVRIARSIRSMQELDAYAARVGARIALEDLPRTCLANTSLETRAMAQAAGNVPICFDVNHLLGESHADFMKALATNVVTTHLSDYDGIDERHWLPGEGIVPWRQIFLTLMENGYRGPFLFELRRGPNGPYGAEETLKAFTAALEKE